MNSYNSIHEKTNFHIHPADIFDTAFSIIPAFGLQYEVLRRVNNQLLFIGRV